MSRITGVQSNRLLQRKRIELILYFVGTLVLASAMLCILSLTSRWSALRITNVTVTGANILNQADITKYVQVYTTGLYGHLFARDNIYLYPKSVLQNSLLQSFPRMQSVSLTVGDDRVLTVAIQERKSIALWCGSDIPSDASQQPDCYYVDSLAYIFEQAPNFSDSVYIKYYTSLATSTPERVGSVLFDTQDFADITLFVSNLSKLGLKPYAITRKDIDGYELRTAYGSIYFNLASPLDHVFENVRSFLAQHSLANRFGPPTLPHVSYIDGRFGDTIIFRP